MVRNSVVDAAAKAATELRVSHNNGKSLLCKE
jgi:hypothetical protein